MCSSRSALRRSPTPAYSSRPRRPALNPMSPEPAQPPGLRVRPSPPLPPSPASGRGGSMLRRLPSPVTLDAHCFLASPHPGAPIQCIRTTQESPRSERPHSRKSYVSQVRLNIAFIIHHFCGGSTLVARHREESLCHDRRRFCDANGRRNNVHQAYGDGGMSVGQGIHELWGRGNVRRQGIHELWGPHPHVPAWSPHPHVPAWSP
jgi:hypothetical protein